MSDRTLLELAAKAAGLEDYENELGRGPIYRKHHTGLQDWVRWNPLDDDGDALRLAVKLGLHLTNGETYAWASHLAVMATELFGTDPDAATRRAITRAAAEIGRNMT